MIFYDLSWLILGLTCFIVIVLDLILIGKLWVVVPDLKCSYCDGDVTTCKIVVTDENGTNIYCNPYCLEQGLKYAKKSKH